jgi:hypothetical protein
MTETFDKIRVLQSHLETAVILVSLEHGYVSAHTIIMAAVEELFRNLYVKKDLFVSFDYRIYVKDEHQKEYLRKTREKYNFFKHADRDTDAKLQVDDEQPHRLNEILLGLLVFSWRETFSKTSLTMSVYGQWFAVNYPDYIKWQNVSDGEKIRQNIKNIDADKIVRRQTLRVMLYSEDILPRDDFDLLAAFDSLNRK